MKILFLGDLYFDCDNIPGDLIKISEYIRKNNLTTILNLEGTLKSESHLNKGVCLSFSDKYVEVLKMLNVKAVNLANNHIMDYKEEGLKKLLKSLDDENIAYFGAGIDLKHACEPYIFNEKDKSIALMGMGWNMEECVNATNKNGGTCPLDFNLLHKIINNTNVDIFIPILHMGYEYENLPQPYHLKECRNLLKNNKVKLIIGHHPHVVQAYEKQIFYSLGNFFFGTRREIFNKKKERIDCNHGIGVIYNTKDNSYEVIKFQYDGKETRINNNAYIRNLEDISEISTNEYTKYFYKNNRFKNKKYVYKIGIFNELILNKLNYVRRNSYKIYLRKIKWPLIKLVKKLIGRS